MLDESCQLIVVGDPPVILNPEAEGKALRYLDGRWVRAKLFRRMGEGYLGRKDASSESGQIAGKLGPCWIVGIVRFFRGSLHMHEEHADGAKVKVDLVSGTSSVPAHAA